ncbi:deoxyguanosinetriphosphate triphosphohydrolase family protein [Pasteurellaceae bacterium 20609_3]|uniref:anti-phage deoxyguanosine triphosphatase n=1 Tax=Spirabiliibacterium mucosae TaxID=28156 RepID=UPI001AAC9BAD|nr:anti-phage deoxyguanosine triphosphatase [Spirabiliibacterium mucosae]MBE2898166.1 deoxyguanosinetriphosphate triphosphohydrolase family protein [Spirabiliibacterium mucosae]
MQQLLQQPWAARLQSDNARDNDYRSPFQRDRGRLLHSAAFRCLQAKTQIHAVGENDFYRTRLTHSLEVAQIGSSLRMQLKQRNVLAQLGDDTLAVQAKAALPSISLVESLCFAHDIGHPPFGHGGEVALNYMMCQHGGFEGNAQTFRILTKLEPYTQSAGMNLTRRTLLGVVKYPTILDESSPQYAQLPAQTVRDPRYINMGQWRPGKGIFRDDKVIFDWVLSPLSDEERQEFCRTQPRESAEQTVKTLYKSLDCSIMELADDIAYAVHDLEDAIVVGMVNLQHWQQALTQLKQCHSQWIREHIDQLTENLFSNLHFERKNAIGALVNFFITAVRWKVQAPFQTALLRFNAELPAEVIEVLQIFKIFVRDYVIRHVNTQRIEYKGQRILTELFQIFASDPERLLPTNTANRWRAAQDNDKHRIICDYIAGMSDSYALKVYQQL